MTKHCLICNNDVEYISPQGDGHVFFNIVQATTIMLTNLGVKDAKRQSTSYVCEECYTTKSVEWRKLTHYRWVDNMNKEDM